MTEPKRPLGGSKKEMFGQPVTSGKLDSVRQQDKVGQADQSGQLYRLSKLNNEWVRKRQPRSKEKVNE